MVGSKRQTADIQVIIWTSGLSNIAFIPTYKNASLECAG
ncbi:hypothetical protein MGSAQ_002321 [marine sediment metagenome]|uniref:Uncharacterized protein n=1 Tax=marine sediment metagenome TaxID=412755 RepID=A0A1B6NRT4_9ZZZZ